MNVISLCIIFSLGPLFGNAAPRLINFYVIPTTVERGENITFSAQFSDPAPEAARVSWSYVGAKLPDYDQDLSITPGNSTHTIFQAVHLLDIGGDNRLLASVVLEQKELLTWSPVNLTGFPSSFEVVSSGQEGKEISRVFIYLGTLCAVVLLLA